MMKSAASEIARKAPCPCGSGKKYKNCCATENARHKRVKSLWVKAVLWILAIVLLAFGINSILRDRDARAPAQRVWSPEHGHWHNIQGRPGDRNTNPQPPGSPPPGKVWSPEHGHWHDVR